MEIELKHYLFLLNGNFKNFRVFFFSSFLLFIAIVLLFLFHKI